jgi:hypothetical protein
MNEPTGTCPICKSKVPLLDRTGDATGFHCDQDGDFKVADTVFEISTCRDASREQWKRALSNAKRKAKPGEWPKITHYDF